SKKLERLVKKHPELIRHIVARLKDAYQVCKKHEKYLKENDDAEKKYHPKTYVIYGLVPLLKGHSLALAKSCFPDMIKKDEYWVAGFRGMFTTVIFLKVDENGQIVEAKADD
ncbi:unnamed protein product, partial [marine sediment metagenome]